MANRGRLQAGRCFPTGLFLVAAAFTSCAFGDSTRSAVDVRYRECDCDGLSDLRERRCYATLDLREREYLFDIRGRDHFYNDYRERDA